MIFHALPHELHFPVIGLADETVHVEAREIHLGHEIVAAEESLNRMKPLHLEVFILDSLVGLAEICILLVPFFRTGKKVNEWLLEVSSGSPLIEPILMWCLRFVEHAGRSSLLTRYLAAESKGGFVLQGEI